MLFGWKLSNWMRNLMGVSERVIRARREAFCLSRCWICCRSQTPFSDVSVKALIASCSAHLSSANYKVIAQYTQTHTPPQLCVEQLVNYLFSISPSLCAWVMWGFDLLACWLALTLCPACAALVEWNVWNTEYKLLLLPYKSQEIIQLQGFCHGVFLTKMLST